MSAMQDAILAEELPRGGNAALVAGAGRIPPERMRTLSRLLQEAAAHFREGLEEVAGLRFEVSGEEPVVRTPAETDLEPGAWAACPFEAGAHGHPAAILLDRQAVNLVVETFLGGGAEGRAPAPERAFSSFDLLLAGQAANVLARALNETVGKAAGIEIAPDAADADLAVRTLAQDARAAIVWPVRLAAAGEEGQALLVMPATLAQALKPCRVAHEETEHADPHWRRALDARLAETGIACAAVLDGGEMPLNAVASLEVGDILWLKTTPDTPVRFVCDGETLFTCELGQERGFFSLQLLGTEPGTRDFLAGLARAAENRPER